ncbi:hypothetical protein NC653_014080 [Populus alba x Populus x berolinensis]|uniref:Uncharacterized protein n=1 Tax=Populus alba x Populus x berolinensis TaxID=444605 RepID=A0AAD6QWC7_9ROSI|nr:hypothetical protein NC653_014080 [Populus alba x Populus x berolinensis]
MFDALVVDQILRFMAVKKSQDTKRLCRWYMTICHTTDKYENFRRFIRGRVVKGVISLNEEYMQIIELLDSSELLRSKMMQEGWNNIGVKVNVNEKTYPDELQ